MFDKKVMDKLIQIEEKLVVLERHVDTLSEGIDAKIADVRERIDNRAFDLLTHNIDTSLFFFAIANKFFSTF